MNNKVYDMLDIKPCDIQCGDWPFMLAVKCDDPWCTYSELVPIKDIIEQTENFCEVVNSCISWSIANAVSDWLLANQWELDCASIASCLTTNGVPAWISLFTLNWSPVTVWQAVNIDVSWSQIDVQNSDSIWLNLFNGMLTASAIISPTASNGLQVLWNWLFVSNASSWISYDNTISWLSSTNVKTAIDELTTMISGAWWAFTIRDVANNNQSVAAWDAVSFLWSGLIKGTVSATDTVTYSINTTWATSWQVITYNGANAVWGNWNTFSFSVSDGVNTQPINNTNTVTFTWTDLITAVVSPTDNVTHSINVSWATSWEGIIFNGVNAVWWTPNNRKYSETITPVINTQATITHNLGSTDVVVQVRLTSNWEVVYPKIVVLDANTVGITSTTNDELRVVVM